MNNVIQITKDATRKYTKDHEWVSFDADIATVGITDYAQGALGELVFVDLPEVGSSFSKGESFASVESVKAASDVYAPISGTVTDVNSNLQGESSTVNKDPFGAGWLAKFKVDNPDQNHLLDEAAYKKLLDSLKKK